MKFGKCFITYRAFKHWKINGFDIVIILWFLKTIVKVLIISQMAYANLQVLILAKAIVQKSTDIVQSREPNVSS